MAELETQVQQALDKAGISYEVLECDPGFADTAAFCEKYGYQPNQAANTILVAAKKGPEKYAACVVLATTKLDVNKKVCQLLETKRASFADAEHTKVLTGMMIGGVTVFGLPEHIAIYVDETVMKQPQVIIGGGNRSSKLLLDPTELNKLAGVKIIEGLAIGRE